MAHTTLAPQAGESVTAAVHTAVAPRPDAGCVRLAVLDIDRLKVILV